MADLPPPVQQGVERALANLGHAARVTSVRPTSGGCINHGARLETSLGASFFLKWNASAPPKMFEAEAEGLQSLAARCPVRIPAPVARGGGAGVPGWLLLEYIPQGPPSPEYATTLGHGLATLHAAGGVEHFGWGGNNWIGSLTQSNTESDSWSEFWRRERIQPQLEAARAQGFLAGSDGKILDDLVDAIPRALADLVEIPPSVLHGDLWSGNAYADDTGAPVLIDPAVYAGHGEVDLAMTELFGGFGARFYAAYDELVAITEAYHAYRRDLYQIYYLLVHVNLFGASYVSGTVSAASRVLGSV